MWYNFSYLIWKIFPYRIKVKEVKNFDAVTWFPWSMQVDPEDVGDEVLVRHEQIHALQMIDGFVLSLLFVGVLGWYSFLFIAFQPLVNAISYLVIYIFTKSEYLAYRNSCIEIEAYTHQSDPNYLANRIPVYSMLRYLFSGGSRK